MVGHFYRRHPDGRRHRTTRRNRLFDICGHDSIRHSIVDITRTVALYRNICGHDPLHLSHRTTTDQDFSILVRTILHES